jgi:Na+-driven multidrug efflux pump
VDVGMPNAIGCLCLMTGWSLCYQLLALHTSSLMFTAYSIAFTIFNVMFFVMDGMSKAVGTLCSNFIGAGQQTLMRAVLKQSCRLTFFFALFFLAFLLLANPMIRFFSSEELFANPLFKYQTFMFLTWYWVMFVLDTLRFCAQYFMFALTKTKVVLIFNVLFCWGLIIIPTYYFVVKLKKNPIIYLQLACLECFLLLVIFKRWFNKETWLQQKKINP